MILNKSTLNIIIDTDPGTDDALALGVAAAFFRNNIRALVSTYGNVGGERTYINLVNLAGLLEIDCDIIKGSLYPLGKNSFTPTDYHGENGLCGLELPKAPFSKELSAKLTEDYNPPSLASLAPPPLKKGALQNLYNIIKEYGNIKYIAIGPLTNIALLLDEFPDVIDYIGELIIMGGGFDVSNMPNNTEYNFSTDAEAVGKVLASPVKKVIAPLDMTHKLEFSLSEIEDITGLPPSTALTPPSEREANAVTGAVTVMAKLFYLNYYTSVRNGNGGAIIHDANTLAYLLGKSKCVLREYKIISDEYGAVSKNSDGYDATVIEEIDRDFVKGLLRGIFK